MNANTISKTFYESNGKISVYYTAANDVINSVIEQQTELGNFYIQGAFDPNEYYVDVNTKIAVKIPEKPNIYSFFNYETKVWELRQNSLGQILETSSAKINSLSNDFILEKYPIYKQLNNIGTSDYQIMRDYIDSIRNKSNEILTTLSALSENVTPESSINLIKEFETWLADFSSQHM